MIGAVPDRTFPYSPRSTATLRIGDLVAIPDGGRWAVIQVAFLQASGPGARTTFGAGILPWGGPDLPTAADVAGLGFIERGLTGIELFTQGGMEVVATAPLCGGSQSNLDDFSVGTMHSVWGWRTAVRRALAAASSH